MNTHGNAPKNAKNLLGLAINDFVHFIKSPISSYGDSFLKFCILFNFLHFLKVYGFSRSSRFATTDVGSAMLCLLTCVFLSYYNFAYYTYPKLRIIMLCLPIKLILFITGLYTGNNFFMILPMMSAFIFILAFFISKLKTIDIKKVAVYLFYFEISMCILRGYLFIYPYINVVNARINLLFAIFVTFGVIIFLKQATKEEDEWQKKNMKGCFFLLAGFLHGHFNIALTPIFFVWLPLPGFGYSFFFIATIQYICMLATTPFYLEIIIKYSK